MEKLIPKLVALTETHEAFIQMSRDIDTTAHDLIKSTYAMMLFGCPNQGMDVASLIPMCEGKANEAFLLSLRQISERLRQICRDFPKAFPFFDSRIISFYETRLSPSAIRVRFLHPNVISLTKVGAGRQMEYVWTFDNLGQ